MTLHTCDEGLFWYYISERHRIYLKKEVEQYPKPWSQDPIFQKYKFVNVFRELDRTTKWMLEHFSLTYPSHPALIAANICWYRMFNRWETGQALGWRCSWDEAAVLAKLRKADWPVFTGAYIIHSDPDEAKLDSIVRVCSVLWNICSSADWAGFTSMKDAWKELQKAKHVGPFMAYQMVLDMLHSDLSARWADKSEWTCTGPGALRGLKRLDPSATMKDSLERMRDLQARSRLELQRIGTEHVPDLSIHDVEFCLCELDKYCRVKFGEGRPRSTYPGA